MCPWFQSSFLPYLCTRAIVYIDGIELALGYFEEFLEEKTSTLNNVYNAPEMQILLSCLRKQLVQSNQCIHAS